MTLDNILKPGMKGLFYGRYSTYHQDISRQRQMVLDLVKEYDCEIVREYLDKGVSSRKHSIKKRKYLQKILTELDDFKYDFIAVSENDRLARKTIEHQLLRTTFLMANVPVVICNPQGLYNPKDADILVQLVSDGITQYEVRNILTNTRNGMKARVKSGLWSGGQPVFGYKYDKETGEFHTYPEELEVVKEIYQLYKQGLGFKAIASRLPPIFNKGKPWTKDKVKSIITTPFYAGYISWGKRAGNSKNSIDPDVDNWVMIKSEAIEPIMDKKDWEHCWKLYKEKRFNKYPQKHFNTRFLLKGLAYCKECKQPLETKNQTSSKNNKVFGTSIYRCIDCGVRYEMEALHDYVIQRTLNDIVLSNKEIVLENLKNEFNDEIKTIETEIEVLKQAVGKYQNQINEIKNKLLELMKAVNTEREKQIITIVSLLRLNLNIRLVNTLNLINNKTNEIKVLKEIDCDEDHLLSLIKAAHNGRNDMEDHELRQLLLHFIKSLEVGKDNKISFVNRANLMKQKASDQLEFDFL